MSIFKQEFEVVKKWGQWHERDYPWGKALVNPDPNDEEYLRFYAFVQFGEQPGFLLPEPSLAFATSAELQYVNSAGASIECPQGKISGIICQDGPRFSLSAAVFKSIEWSVNPDGSVTIDGEVWWPSTLFDKDKNRYRQEGGEPGVFIQNFDGYFVRSRPDTVRVLELGELDLF